LRDEMTSEATHNRLAGYAFLIEKYRLLMAARKLTISAGEKVNQSASVKKLTTMLFLPILHAQNPSTYCFSSFFTSPM